ncbi:hypothetical protein [Mucilaginibacter sp.]|uniref:hypothetical protein n=1 Tax=Mucilaginibacter sp. TaxID=1882438 RepID=UPI003D0E1B9F
MTTKSVESQAREYLYDVKNCASEYGQSTLEGWEFNLVTDVEKTKLEKTYYPTVSARPAKEALLELFNLVKSKILLPAGSIDNGFDMSTITNKDVAYLIAFNPKLHR